MFFHEKLFENVLIEPFERLEADELLIFSGFASFSMANRHLNYIQAQGKSLNINLIIGMIPYSGIDESSHKGFARLMNESGSFSCSYYTGPHPVHSKLYIWNKNGKPIEAYAGSANYSQSAFFGHVGEIIVQCNPSLAYKYFYQNEKESTYCNYTDIEQFININKHEKKIRDKVSNERILADTKIIDHVKISFLDAHGNLPKRSGLNWGQRPELHREPNQAYIRVPIEIARTGFFPERKIHFTMFTDDDKSIVCATAQDYGKAIHSPLNNSLIGEYFRNRLSISNGELIEKRHLIEYGRTDVDIYKIDNETYYMDFSV